MTRRVVVTGMAGISPIGCDWPSIEAALRAERNAIQYLPEWEAYDGLNTRLGAPAAAFALPVETYTRKRIRSMGRIALMAARASELALADAGLLADAALLGSGRVGVSYGSSAGSPPAIGDFGRMIYEKTTEGVNANSYIKMMAHTTPVNIAVFFGLTGRVITTSSACTSGSQGIGYAYETIKYGHADVMIAGGAEELCATEAAVFDTLFATSTRNDTPSLTPRPYDAGRDGLVIGEGAGTLILEEYEHAMARGAHIHAELVGFGTNCDGSHVTQPQAATMAQAMKLALADAGLASDAIGYVNGHGTATEQGDIAETQATHAVFGERMPISSLKSYVGHTLGACGALEAWWSIMMMNTGWFAPTINLTEIDPRCAPLDYLVSGGRNLDCDYVMSNNFAFGGINTSLIFKKYK
ncbi:beta-ketoacyl-ACP synthase II [Jeongeupia sp. HS-3]|uniref:beta-ketoacyl-ACP synthase n=1 Tax=Jeongeupia sp. HS-3 TaxID=1009682 RepID=UPI0018A35112|nr:beta-ketoacyl-ACP synthase [Jeongeupia sp. HS-3]BCL77379.1 beta-ketoacyl-ACP synthase II [Jeongeupia sp. HS-3]